MKSRRKYTKLLPGECRIIKASREAVFNLIWETILDREKEYFDILDVRCVTVQGGTYKDMELDAYYCGVYSEKAEDNLDMADGSDILADIQEMENVVKTMGYSASSLTYNPTERLYKTVCKKDNNYEVISTSSHPKIKRLRDGEYRMICVPTASLGAFAAEVVIRNLEDFFHIKNRDKVNWVWQIDEDWVWQIDKDVNFMFAVYNQGGEGEPNLDELSRLVGVTIDDFFSAGALYKSIVGETEGGSVPCGKIEDGSAS